MGGCSGASHAATLVSLTQSHQTTVDELNRGYLEAKKSLADKCEECRCLEVCLVKPFFSREFRLYKSLFGLQTKPIEIVLVRMFEEQFCLRHSARLSHTQTLTRSDALRQNQRVRSQA